MVEEKEREAKAAAPASETKKSHKELTLENISYRAEDIADEFMSARKKIIESIPFIKNKEKQEEMRELFQGTKSGGATQYHGAPKGMIDAHQGDIDGKVPYEFIMIEEFSELLEYLDDVWMQVKAILIDEGSITWEDVSDKKMAFKALKDRIGKKVEPAEKKPDAADNIQGELEKI